VTTTMAVLEQLVSQAFRDRASDIHLTGEYFYYRVHGELVEYDSPFDAEGLQVELKKVPEWRDFPEKMAATGSFDSSATIAGCRVRANFSNTQNGLSVVFRLVPDQVASLIDLDVPPAVVEMVKAPNGLVLATGEFGSGKTTLLASLIDYWNNTHKGHILCLEEPTEYLHRPVKSRISQREIPTHAPTWADGIKAARRSDPDVLLVGELRDSEAVSAAMAAASSGILVLATLHAGSAEQAITALLAMTGDERRALVRTQLGQCLRGVVTQQLLPRADGAGRVAAREILLGTDPVRAQILGGEDMAKHIPGSIESGRQVGMQRMDDDLARLAAAGVITDEVATGHSLKPGQLLIDIQRLRERAA
jgi:twitching motility protein PilT